MSSLIKSEKMTTENFLCLFAETIYGNSHEISFYAKEEKNKEFLWGAKIG